MNHINDVYAHVDYTIRFASRVYSKSFALGVLGL